MNNKFTSKVKEFLGDLLLPEGWKKQSPAFWKEFKKNKLKEVISLLAWFCFITVPIATAISTNNHWFVDREIENVYEDPNVVTCKLPVFKPGIRAFVFPNINSFGDTIKMMAREYYTETTNIPTTDMINRWIKDNHRYPYHGPWDGWKDRSIVRWEKIAIGGGSNYNIVGKVTNKQLFSLKGVPSKKIMDSRGFTNTSNFGNAILLSIFWQFICIVILILLLCAISCWLSSNYKKTVKQIKRKK